VVQEVEHKALSSNPSPACPPPKKKILHEERTERHYRKLKYISAIRVHRLKAAILKKI
jgi:hypothetical protein